ncbi:MULTISPECIES: hypothetical protein [Thauera]|jgi:hypothetical protein|uniref:DUF4062 domain-containing protein n=2 Tax=Thauera aminoaromatica TaxID=164330 RepID=C4ZL09_THASP|nr:MULTISPECIES: hypothetical protein [Thauera]ACK52967.1 hypothetical protein Tmz1t_0172 [Thauera aminoaromatica]ENO82709.1 hypothetical protein C665_17159 [Thauera aminoaromatica S2]KIN92312.1 hypothetical protein PO78_4240 [Thauera sp. SWB20]MCK6400158.1 hypothetical protein [Thauera aminoaromatica]TXH79449.1 MAG: hypothetical protein E6Q80_20480 [Thauera aminoaromatica]
MADFRKLRVMISSRCASTVRRGDSRVSMTVVRTRLKRELEAESLCGERLFEVWISDNAPDQSQGDLETAWEKSLEEVRKADIVLVLYTGEAGWAPARGLGVCHAEFQQAWNDGPARLKVVRIGDVGTAPKDAAELKRDQAFQAYFDDLNPTSPAASDVDAIVARSREALREAVAGLVKLGGREARKGRFAYGAPLDWSRLDFGHRKKAMEDALGGGLAEFGAVESSGGWLWPLGETSLLTICHGLPGGFGVAAAREMVGQPFLHDHLFLARALGEREAPAGPLHLVACLKGITESQAMRQLGFPDATIVAAPFGVYVSDPVQKIQMIFLANCRDLTTTRNALCRLAEWLNATGEAANLARRALGRRRVVQAILDVQGD